MRLSIALFVLTIATPVCAQTVGSTSGASSMVLINNPSTTTSTNRLITAPPVGAPGLAAAGVETCLGSAAGGLSLMGGGITFGATKVDEGCTLRLLSRQLFAFGFQKAALALMCQDQHVAVAMDTAGSPCPARPVPVGEPLALMPANPLPTIVDLSDSVRAAVTSTYPFTAAPVEISAPAQNPVQLSFMPVVPFSQQEQAWFDRQSNMN
jgi:hypothetical protein